MADGPIGIRTTHKSGEVVITMSDTEGDIGYAKLDPVAALTHAEQVIKHSDLAREQQMAQEARTV